MPTNIEEISSIRKKITLEIPLELSEPALNHTVDKYAANAKLKGFRPGKAPRSLVAKTYSSNIRQDIFSELVVPEILKAIEDTYPNYIAPPFLEEMDIIDGKPITVTATFDILPTFETPDLSQLTIKTVPVEVKETEIDTQINRLQQNMAVLTPTEADYQAKEGDVVYFSCSYLSNGKKIKGHEGTENLMILAGTDSNPFMEPLAQGVIGTKIGDQKTVPTVFPKNHANPKLAGQEVSLAITITEIKEREIPPIDDDLAKDANIPDVSTLEELRDYLRLNIKKAYEHDVEEKQYYQISKKLGAMADFDVPEALVESEIDQSINDTLYNLRSSGLDIRKEVLESPQMRDSLRENSTNTVRSNLILEKLAEELGITVSDEDIENYYATLAKELNQSLESIKESYSHKSQVAHIRRSLAIGRVLPKVKEKINLVEVTAEELKAEELKAEELKAEELKNKKALDTPEASSGQTPE